MDADTCWQKIMPSCSFCVDHSSLLLHALCPGEALPSPLQRPAGIPSPATTVRRQLDMDRAESPGGAYTGPNLAAAAANEAFSKGLSQEDRKMIQMLLDEDSESNFVQMMLAKAKQKYFVKASNDLS